MKRLHICVPNYRGVIEAQHASSMYALFHLLGQMGQHPLYINPTHTIIQTARQTCVQTALNDPLCSHILWIDDDMVFGPEQYAMLQNEALEHDLDFIGALAFSNSYPTKPCIFGLNPEFQEWGKEPWWHIVTHYPEQQRFEVAAMGFGMVLTSTRMLRALDNDCPFKVPEGMESAFMFSHPGVRNEDVAFCFHARKAGFKLYCDSRVTIGHISKDRPLIDENVYKGQRDALEYANGVHRCEFDGGITLKFPNKKGKEMAGV